MDLQLAILHSRRSAVCIYHLCSTYDSGQSQVALVEREHSFVIEIRVSFQETGNFLCAWSSGGGAPQSSG